jgi:hypothetical protein
MEHKNANGRVLQSEFIETRSKSAILDYLRDIDDPYWWDWEFCPPAYYVMGMKLNFDDGGLAALCRSVTEILEVVQIERKKSENPEYGDEFLCDGVVIGFQVKLSPDKSSTPTPRVRSVRLFCSIYNEAEMKHGVVESEYEIEPNQNDIPVFDEETPWQEPQFCGKQEAVCGFKVIDGKHYALWLTFYLYLLVFLKMYII